MHCGSHSNCSQTVLYTYDCLLTATMVRGQVILADIGLRIWVHSGGAQLVTLNELQSVLEQTLAAQLEQAAGTRASKAAALDTFQRTALQRAASLREQALALSTHPPRTADGTQDTRTAHGAQAPTAQRHGPTAPPATHHSSTRTTWSPRSSASRARG